MENSFDAEAKNSVQADHVTFTRLKSETGAKVRRALITHVKRAPINPNFVPKARERNDSDESLAKTERINDTPLKSSSKSKVHDSTSHREKKQPHESRKRDDSQDKTRSKDEDRSKREAKKKRPPAPPPMSFNDLLKLAEQKKADAAQAASAPKPAAKPKVLFVYSCIVRNMIYANAELLFAISHLIVKQYACACVCCRIRPTADQ